MPELVLVRHGATVWSGAGRFTGHRDIALSAEGLGQARVTAARLAASRPAAVVSSDLARAAATAEVVASAANLAYTVDPRLREEDLGGWSGLTHAEVRARFPDEYARWVAGEVWDPSRNREGLTAVADRALPAIEDALPAHGPLVVVTHANTAYAVVHRLLGVAGPWADLPPAGYVKVTAWPCSPTPARPGR